MRQLALQFGCGKTQILNILGQRESYLREWEEKEGPSNPHIGARKRRSRRTGNEETNRMVWDWYQQQKNSGLRVTGPMLQREARSIARSLGISNFAASNGWLDSFRRLHNIVSVSACPPLMAAFVSVGAQNGRRVFYQSFQEISSRSPRDHLSAANALRTDQTAPFPYPFPSNDVRVSVLVLVAPGHR